MRESKQFPLLERLYLQAVSGGFEFPESMLTWPAPGLMKGLRKFSYSVASLTGLQGGISPTISELLEGLRYCSRLEYLSLAPHFGTFLETAEEMEERVRHSPPVHLPHLKHIKLFELTGRQFIVLSRLLSLLKSKDVKIELSIHLVGHSQLFYLVFAHVGTLARNRIYGAVDDWTVRFGGSPMFRGLLNMDLSSPLASQNNVDIDIADDQRKGWPQPPEPHRERVIDMSLTDYAHWGRRFTADNQVHFVTCLCAHWTSSLSLYDLTDWTVKQWEKLLSHVPHLRFLTLGGENIKALCSFLDIISPQRAGSRIPTPQNNPTRQRKHRFRHLRLSAVDFSAPVPSQYGTRKRKQGVVLQTFLTQVLQERKQCGLQITKLTLWECRNFEETDASALRESVRELTIC